MPRMYLPALCAVLLAFGWADASAQVRRAPSGQIPAEQAPDFIGSRGTVCGLVVTTKFAQSAEGEPTFLHVGAAFPKHPFQVRINGADRASFGFAPEEALEGKIICATGRIAGRGNRAEMTVDSPSNLALGVTAG